MRQQPQITEAVGRIHLLEALPDHRGAAGTPALDHGHLLIAEALELWGREQQIHGRPVFSKVMYLVGTENLCYPPGTGYRPTSGKQGLSPSGSDRREKQMKTKLDVKFEYNGQTYPLEVPPDQQIEGAWHRALTHFGIRPEDAQSQNLGLFLDGNVIDRNQSFEAAGVQSGALLRIQPIVARTGWGRA